jgi:hypothetical protein
MKRITVTLDEKLYKKVKEIAEHEHRSMSGQVAHLLSTHPVIAGVVINFSNHPPQDWGGFYSFDTNLPAE